MDDLNMEHGLGALPSAPDYRSDYVAAAMLSEAVADVLAPSYKTDLSPFEVLMQSKIPACVCHWAALAMSWYWYKKTGEVVHFSPRFLDILSSQPWIPIDGGRDPHTVLRMAATFGCCTTDLLPNDTNLSIQEYRNPNVITQAMREQAAKYKIPGYIKVPTDVISTRRAIQLFGLVGQTQQIGKEWWTGTDGVTSWDKAKINPLRPPVAVVSGHQTTLMGWDSPDQNRLRNSWSKDWCDNGEADQKIADWLPFTYEQWAIADIPDDLKTFLANLPAPQLFHYQWNKNMAFGDKNDDVKYLQIALMILGILEIIPPDQLGYYGKKTATAVQKYQQSKKISPTDPFHCGPLTRGKLNIDFAL